MFHVAVVDDEEELLFSLKIILEAEGWQMSVYSDAASALTRFKESMPDVIVMDIMMPGENGIWLCRRVREIAPTVPIIFLSAKIEEIDRIAGFESGADDYLGKPFSTRELIARIRVQKRHAESQSEGGLSKKILLRQDGYTLSEGSMTLTFESSAIPLTLSEFRILNLMMSRPETICTRQELLASVYEEDTYVSDRVIDNHVKRIRSKIEQLSDGRENHIETVYGIGYRWIKI